LTAADGDPVRAKCAKTTLIQSRDEAVNYTVRGKSFRRCRFVYFAEKYGLFFQYIVL
jgi:hypothetical protein